MPTINWNAVRANGLPVGRPTAALSQTTAAFNALAKQGTRNRILDTADATAAQARQDAIDLKQEAADLKQAGIDAGNSNALFAKNFFSDNQKRLDTPDLQRALMGNKAYREASPEQQKIAKTNYLNSLGDSTIRRATTFSNDYESHLRSLGTMSTAEIDAEVGRAVGKQFPTSSKEERTQLLDILKLKDGIGTGFGSRSAGTKSKASASKELSTEDISDITNTLKLSYGLPDQSDTTFGIRSNSWNPARFGHLNPSVADLNTVISYLSDNGIKSPLALRNTLNQAMNPNGSVKPQFDWTEPEGQAALLAAARKSQKSNPLPVDPATGYGGRVGASQEFLDGAEQVMGTANPRSVANQTIVDALTSHLPGRTPQAQAAINSYLDAGGKREDNGARTYPFDIPSPAIGNPIVPNAVPPQPQAATTIELLNRLGVGTDNNRNNRRLPLGAL